MEQKKPLSLVFAIPDHPWVDSPDRSDVRIAMTVGEAGDRPGILYAVVQESDGSGEGVDVTLSQRFGKLHSDLRVGPNVASVKPLQAMQDISNRGVVLHGKGFIVTADEARQLGLRRIDGVDKHIRNYMNYKDLTQTDRGVMVIDLFGLSADEVRERFPEVYQHVVSTVKEERDHNPRESRRKNWWLFGETNPKLRRQLSGLRRYIAIGETGKHRFFVFLDESILPDNMLVNIAIEDAYHLGVLSSRIHVAWALAAGGTLEDRPRYNKTRCFATFPFPEPNETQRSRIRDLAEQLDARRKHRQKLRPKLTLTGIYNVLEKLRTGEELTDKEKEIHEQGLVTVLAELHDELDEAVLEAYGWSDLGPALIGKPGGATPSAHKSPEQIEAEETLLERLVQLNAERATEEEQGVIRWLRPEFQSPEGPAATQKALIVGAAPDEAAAKRIAKRSWPKSLPDQVKALRAALAEQPGPVRPEQIARSFKRAQTKKVAELLETLAALGQARVTEDNRFAGN